MAEGYLMLKIPFVPLPMEVMLRISRRFLGIGTFLSKIFPTMKIELIRANIDLDEREYLTVAFFSSFLWCLFTLIILLFLSFFKEFSSSIFFFLIPFALLFSVFFYIRYYPGLITIRKIKDLEKNLLFALRSMEIQIGSGISLFDSLVSISREKYGLISEEFKKVIKKISTGKSEIEALEDLVLRNPSLYFRRIIWQITNSIKSGADLSSTLRVIVEDLSYERLVSIRKYGSQLNPMAMIYMMMAVIFPSLGVSFLMILSSFSNVKLTELVFWFILGFTAFFQFIFIGLIKSRRPTVE
jgi:flagellar protein FlaJ